MIKPKSRHDSRKNMDLLVSAFEQNYSIIVAFLPWEEQLNVKLSTIAIIQFWTGRWSFSMTSTSLKSSLSSSASKKNKFASIPSRKATKG
jgi:hypothetical protein